MTANCISIFVENHTNNIYSKSLGKMKKSVFFYEHYLQIRRISFWLW